MHLQVRPLTTFSRLMAQMMRTHARVCVFLALVDIVARLGDQIAQNPNFGGVNRDFPAKFAKY